MSGFVISFYLGLYGTHINVSVRQIEQNVRFLKSPRVRCNLSAKNRAFHTVGAFMLKAFDDNDRFTAS